MRMQHAVLADQWLRVSAWRAPGQSSVNVRVATADDVTGEWLWGEIATWPLMRGVGVAEYLRLDWQLPTEGVIFDFS